MEKVKVVAEDYSSISFNLHLSFDEFLEMRSLFKHLNKNNSDIILSNVFGDIIKITSNCLNKDY